MLGASSVSYELIGTGLLYQMLLLARSKSLDDRILAGRGGDFQTEIAWGKDQVPERPLGQTQQRLYAVRSTFDRL